VNRELEIFSQALEIASPEEREAFVRGACLGDAELLARIEKLLGSTTSAIDFFPTVAGEHTAPIKDGVGSTIGRYKLLQKIGEGGFGVVYMADQREPVKRRVALKIIKLGMDTKQVVGRFEAERQALAMMDHPNIARVLDGGATEDGRPYFVMELVRGIPITEYCDEHKLTTEGRLGLFEKVCAAIQHAHQKGIIHRDLKPSNVLVAPGDEGRPHPKVIDFGIAKATQQELTDKTLFTRFEDFVGTPAYMSPEQAGSSQLDIDTRSDIYSLGVLLYELLTGSTPLDYSPTSGIDEIRRRIREDEPQRPSTRLNSIEQGAQTRIAECRAVDSESLRRTLRNELDWIIMKAIDKDRARRYDSAAELGRDVESFLRGDTVQACPPTMGYRIRKLVRRNKSAIAVAGAVVIALAIGVIAATWQAVRAIGEKQRGDELLWESQIVQAEALLNTNKPGRRHEALETIQKAAAYRPTAKLRNQAIAAMALPDALLLDSFKGEIPPHAQTCIDPKGKRYCIGTEEGEVTILDLDDHREIGRLPNQGSAVGQMEFSASGRFLSVWKFKGGVKVWDLEKSYLLANFPDASLVDFALEGSRLAVATPAREIVEVIDVKVGNEVIWSTPVSGRPQKIRLDRTGQKIAIAIRGSSKIAVHDLSGKSNESPTLLTFPAPVHGLGWHPSGDFIAVGLTDFTIHLWDFAAGKIVNVLKGHDSQAGVLAFNPEGTLLVSYGWDRVTRVWEPFTGVSEMTLLGKFERFLADGKRIQMDFDEKGAAIWELTSSAEGFSRFRIGGRTQNKAISLAFSPGNKSFAAASASQLNLWELQSGDLLASAPTKATTHVRFGNSEKQLFTSSADRGLRKLELKRGAEIGGRELVETAVLVEPPTSAFDYGRNESTIALLKQDERKVSLIDADSGAELQALRGDKSFASLALGPNAQRIAIGTWHGRGLRVWDLALDAQTPVELLKEERHTIAEFDHDANWLAAYGSPSGRCHLWRFGEWDSPVHSFTANSSTNFAFDPAGKFVASEVESGNVGLVDLKSFATFAEFRPPISNPSRIRNIAISGDGQHLAVSTGRREIFVWNLSSVRKKLEAIGLDWE